jgi:FkbM family methyltransferase
LNPWIIRARSLARKTGIIRAINRFRPARSYEERVHKVLTDAIKPGDVVWDVGANIGIYSELFCQIVGDDGLVVAFEPLPDSCEQIRARIPNCECLRIEAIALGDEDRPGRLVTQENSYENHIQTDGHDATGSLPVQIRRGDTVWKTLARTPNVVKVDVEGFEEEVLQGMQEMLESAALRSVLIEVHFLKLEMRGRATAPTRIQKLLIGKGYRTTWVDASHLFATR